MTERPQFAIRDVIGFTMAVSLPLAMISSDTPLRMPGWVLLVGLGFGGIAYLIGQRAR